MPIPLFTNNAATALAVAITPTDTVLQITAGTGSEFPSPTGGNYFMLTLVQINNPEVSEIVKCINRTGDYLTVERGQENTQPQIFNISDNVQLRITAQSLNLFAQGGGGGGGGTAATQVAEFTATQGQTVFNIPFSYVPDNYNLAVFVNGSKQIIDVNYSESSSTSITFFTGLNVGDLVEVVYNLPIAAGQIDASNILYDQGGIGAVESTVQKKLEESVSVKDFGAVGDGVTDDTAAIQAACDASKSVYFPQQPGSFYKCTSKITLGQGANIYGEDKAYTIIKFFGCSGFEATQVGGGAYNITFKNIGIVGDGTGTNCQGITLNGNTVGFGEAQIEGVGVSGFSGTGIVLAGPITSQLYLVTAESNGGDGFYIQGAGTSTILSACYANLNGGDGYTIFGELDYCSFVSCASDSNGGHGYNFAGSIASPAQNVSLISCGSEKNGLNYYNFQAVLGLTLTSCYVNPTLTPIGGNFIEINGCKNVSLNGINMPQIPATGKYALNFDTIGGAQFPSNIVTSGCQFYSVGGLTNVISGVNYIDLTTAYTNKRLLSGTTSAANAATITHNLGLTPTAIYVTTPFSRTFCSADLYTSTTFRLLLNDYTGAPISTAQTINWTVIV